jgi:hypothetical protein
MANPEDQSKAAEQSAAAAETPPAAETAKADASAAAPADETITIEPRALILADRAAWSDAPADSAAAEPPIEPEPRHWSSRAPLAAGLALTLSLGALAGAAATAGLMRDTGPPPALTAAAEQNRVLRESQARLESELASLKTAIASGQRSAIAQIGRITERLDKTEKAQAEPAARLARMAESLDRLERRIPTQVAAPVAAAAAPAAATAPAPPAPAAAEVTGSVAVKQDAKPPVAEGWSLLDVYAGRAVVESRNGRVFEVGPGSNLPGLGRVEAVKREDGRVIVVTRNGVIAASVERRRPSRYFYGD